MKTRAQVNLTGNMKDKDNLVHIIGLLADELKHADSIGSHFASFPVAEVEDMIERLRDILYVTTSELRNETVAFSDNPFTSEPVTVGGGYANEE